MERISERRDLEASIASLTFCSMIFWYRRACSTAESIHGVTCSGAFGSLLEGKSLGGDGSGLGFGLSSGESDTVAMVLLSQKLSPAQMCFEGATIPIPECSILRLKDPLDIRVSFT